jgi:hypothetical protein
LSEFLAKGGIPDQALHLSGQIRDLAAKSHTTVVGDLSILGCVEVKYGIPRRHSVDQRGVTSPRLAGRNVKTGIPQELPILFAVDPAGKNHTIIRE